jgi:hypothetical protein
MINPNQLGRRPFPAGASQWMLVGLRGTPPPTGLSDGDPVSSWTDSSGNGHTAAQTGSARPIFKTNILNGKPVVRFTTAGGSGLTLVSAVPGASPWTIFAVMKVLDGTHSLSSLISDTSPEIFGPLQAGDGNVYLSDRVRGGPSTAFTGYTAFHVLTGESGGPSLWADGTAITVSGSPGAKTSDFNAIGYRPAIPISGDGDIAEIIVYSGTLALRAKLTLLLTLLLTTGEFPSSAEFDAMVGNRHAIRQYLVQHGAHPTQAQLDAVIDPFAVGDRQNVEKYLGTKYAITVAGGSAVQPDTVAGLVGWWKADSLL